MAARGDTTTTSLTLALPEPDSLISAGEMVRDSDDIAELTSKAPISLEEYLATSRLS